MEKIKNLKSRIEANKASKGCVILIPDELKEEALKLHIASALSGNKFCKELGISPKTLRDWRLFFEYDKPETNYPNLHKIKNQELTKKRSIKISRETKESIAAKKKIKKQQLLSENSETEVPDNEEEIKVKLGKSIDSYIPIVNTKGDHIPQKFRDMQEEWLKNNKPKKYSPGGNLIES